MKLSVILPIYNVEKYIIHCLESLKAQDYQDVEYIMIDDGSPDNCATICQAFAKEDKRFVYIHKDNGGLVTAIKEGLAVARGEYITSVDPDDFIENNLYSRAMRVIIDNDIDCFIFGIREIDDDGRVIAIRVYDKDKMYVDNELAKLKKDFLGTSNTAAIIAYSKCVKIVKKDIFKLGYSFVPNNVSCGEDVCLSIASVLAAKRIYLSAIVGYNYLIHNQSMTHTFPLALYLTNDLLYQQELKTFQYFDYHNEYIELYNAMTLSHGAINAIALANVSRKEKIVAYNEFKKTNLYKVGSASKVVQLRSNKHKITSFFCKIHAFGSLKKLILFSRKTRTI